MLLDNVGVEPYLKLIKTVSWLLRPHSLDELASKIRIVGADPREVEIESIGYYGKILLLGLDISIDGYIETAEGIGEVVIGLETLANLHITIDYCAGTLSIRPCK